jgi:hypothetical protein
MAVACGKLLVALLVHEVTMRDTRGEPSVGNRS